jgi:parallel beta-helix repeat protein
MKGVIFSTGVGKLIAPTAFLAAVVALAAVGSVQARSDSEGEVSCGQTLKASVRLADDLVDCPGNGLIIGANNITVDLNGHTIAGTNAPKSSTGIMDGGCGTNGQTCKGHANVTIENGTITGFHCDGVSLAGSHGILLRNMTVKNVGAGQGQGAICAGIFLMRSTGTRVLNSTVSNDVQAFQVNGIDAYAAPRTRIERSHIDRNAGSGIEVFQSPKSRIVGNELEGNKKQGIGVNASSDSTWVTGNVARGNRGDGIAVGAGSNLLVVGNSASGNGEAGLLLFDLTSSLIRGNRASGNPTGVVLYGGQSGYAEYGGKHGAMHNELVANEATKNTRSGILVRGDGGKDVANDNLLSRNVANGNGRDGGIVLQGSAKGNRLRRNTANANAGHGITATRGTIDAGGNRAHGNHRSPQCVGVACR